jgi:ABC-type glycerol-3-phosphate transport system permease component
MRDELKLITFLALFVPATVLIGPLYWLNTNIGLSGHFAGTFLAMWTIPWLSLILYFYLARLPERMELYAELDGLNPRQIITQLVLPYSYKGLIAVFLLAFLLNYHSLFTAVMAVPREAFALDTSVSFSYLPEMVSLFDQPSEVIPSSMKLLAALAWQAPSVVVLPLLIVFGIPVIQTMATGRYVYRRKLSVFGRQIEQLR